MKQYILELTNPYTLISIVQAIRTILPLLLLAFFSLALIIIPQRWLLETKKVKMQSLASGTRITTAQGMQGVIESVSSSFIILKLDDGRKIEIMHEAVVSIDHEAP